MLSYFDLTYYKACSALHQDQDSKTFPVQKATSFVASNPTTQKTKPFHVKCIKSFVFQLLKILNMVFINIGKTK
jgi:hypothetical protein